MKNINPIYHNPFGMAFQWKRTSVKDIKKVQLVFRDTGLLLSYNELSRFSKNIKHTMDNSPMCSECAQNESCKALFVDSPAPQVTFAMNVKELVAIQDLVEGTLFQLNLADYLGEICEE
ncbi:hypothetical protein [Costertonia aggregata]|uniref:Uncharacterized protein n=1 Tax=Costertonia aggregata TaxID=343403 RepID=A0A7H9AS51_9FLAO|nr:hypothetical protein [Costertonia aggregata]QLG46283.1 hypothetical protein HYG79_13320 [Costertonia aggregata]